ncbi:MAG: hypothetical protein K1Y36_24320 [Blastocatellia bacterium]|nr:hypothetical protein [Blastocatellia bacterium]
MASLTQPPTTGKPPSTPAWKRNSGKFLSSTALIMMTLGGVADTPTYAVTLAEGTVSQRPVAMTEAEMNDYKAAMNMIAAPDTFFPMAEDFLKKYPESRLRGILYRDMIAVYGKAKQPAKAFETGDRALKEKPENISVMMQLAEISANLTLTDDKTYADQGLKLANQAVSMIEGGKRPYEFTEEQWQSLRPKRFSQLYVTLGVLQWKTDTPDAAVDTLIKALQLSSRDPYAQLMLGKSQNSLLKNLTAKVATEKNPTVKKDLEAKITTLKEQMMLSYTRALVLSEEVSYAWLHPSVEAELSYVYKTMPELADSQSLSAQTLTNRVRSEQNAEPAKQ